MLVEIAWELRNRGKTQSRFDLPALFSQFPNQVGQRAGMHSGVR